jgi:aminopeptidase
MRRSAEGSLRWVGTLYPTDAYAQDADMSTADFTEFVYAAGKLDAPDPAAAWREVAAEQERLIDWLKDKRQVHVRARDTDLKLGIEGRTWISADGKMNFPDGEIFTAPVEDAVDGHIRFSFPAVTQGREVDDIRLRFVGGRVVDASAAKNEAFLINMLDTDAGARTLGEFAIGTNFAIDRFIKNILFDEKIGGTIHMAVGAGYPESGSVNKSAIHWDMVCDLRDGGTIDVDGEPFLRNGRFVV